MSPVLRGSNPQRAPSPSPCWTVCHRGKRDTSRGTGSLPGNLSGSQRNCPGQGRARQAEQGQRPHLALSPGGTATGSGCQRKQRQISPRAGNGGNEGGKESRQRESAAAHTMKVRTFIKGAAEKPRRGRAPQDIKEDSKASTHSDSSRVNKFPLHNKGPAWGSSTGKINTELNESSLMWKQDSP